MKNNEEFRRDVYERYDEYKKNKAIKRSRLIRYGVAAVSVMAIVIAVGAAIPSLVMGRYGSPMNEAAGETLAADKNSSLNVSPTGGEKEYSDGIGSQNDYQGNDSSTSSTRASTQATMAATEATRAATTAVTTAATTAVATEATGATAPETGTGETEETSGPPLVTSAVTENADESLYLIGCKNPGYGLYPETEMTYCSDGGIVAQNTDFVEKFTIPADDAEVKSVFSTEIGDGMKVVTFFCSGNAKAYSKVVFKFRGEVKMNYLGTDDSGYCMFEATLSDSEAEYIYVIYFDCKTKIDIAFIKD